MIDSDENETFEDYLKRTFPADTEIFIYERKHPFLSSEKLNSFFGNIAFFEIVKFNDSIHQVGKNTFNVLLSADCDNEYKAKNILSNYSVKHPLFDTRIIRFGYLKCLFSEQFNPFQETMKRILELKEIKKWVADVLDKHKTHREMNLSFVNGELIAIFNDSGFACM